MSLICVKCGYPIVISTNPDHYGCCHRCGPKLSPEQQKKIEDSSAEFLRKGREARDSNKR